MRLSHEEILAVYKEGPDTVVRLVDLLLDTIDEQSDQMDMMKERTAGLERRVKTLEGQLKLNSRNSSLPPSSDGFAKAPRKRKKTGKSPGGQKGHEGHTLRMVDSPDHTITHAVSRCSCCGRSLEGVAARQHERRQVFDLPVILVEVTEHRAERKVCPACGTLASAAFPEGVDQSVQYGPRARATSVYLNQYQLLPFKRASELMADLFGCAISRATLVNATGAAGERLEAVGEEIKRRIASSSVANFDETGMRVTGRGAWLHVASTDHLTHYAIHPKRGREATDSIGILPSFAGTAVHDCWSPYLTYACSHALCCAHLIRELTFQAEECEQEWAAEMIDLLLEAYEKVMEAKTRGRTKLSRARLKALEERYERILAQGFCANPLPEARGQPKKRGRKKKTKARNLLERLRDYQREVLRFANDFSVPFDNNLAERDLRMAKVKQKVSGTFRSWDGAINFCRIRSYISTVKKNSIPVIDAIISSFEGEPLIPCALQA